MSDELLTTKQAAELIGVGATSIKRWADSGVIECVKTPGGHRRIPRSAVERMLATPALPPGPDTSDAGGWIRTLLGPDPAAVRARMFQEHGNHGSWTKVAESLGPVLEEIGRRWNAGELSIVEEHLATERLARALAQVSDGFDLPASGRTALLLAAQGEEHTLGLSLVELTLRSCGWSCRWLGRGTPFRDVRHYVEQHRPAMVALSASINSSNTSELAEEAARYQTLCRRHGVQLLLGGRGSWPDSPTYGVRVTSLSELAALG